MIGQLFSHSGSRRSVGLRARLVWSLGIADTIGFTQLQLYQLQQTTRRSISRVGVRGIGAAGIYEQLLFGARCEIATSHFCHSVIFPIVTLLLVKVYGVCHSHRKNRKLTTRIKTIMNVKLCSELSGKFCRHLSRLRPTVFTKYNLQLSLSSPLSFS